jgi:hypothetical protein
VAPQKIRSKIIRSHDEAARCAGLFRGFDGLAALRSGSVCGVRQALGSPAIFRDLRKGRSSKRRTRIGAQDLVVNLPAAGANGPHRSDGRLDFGVGRHGFPPQIFVRHFDGRPSRDERIVSSGTLDRNASQSVFDVAPGPLELPAAILGIGLLPRRVLRGGREDSEGFG